MATRERRLAEFDGAGEPPPGLPVQVLCEDQSGTYQLPFTCHYLNGKWRNHESGGPLEAMVVAWRVPANRRSFTTAPPDGRVPPRLKSDASG